MSKTTPVKDPVPALKPQQLKARCDSSGLDFETTDDLESLEGIIGQDRALRAIKLGLGIESFGYNLYVAGTPGTGKKTLLRSLVDEIAAQRETPDDLFCVHNFDEPERPNVISARAGTACALAGDMDRLVETLIEEVPKAFKSEDYEDRRGQIIQSFHERRAELVETVQKRADERHLAVKSSGSQIMTVPVVEGEELSPEQYENLPDDRKKEIQDDQRELSETIQEIYREIRREQQKTQERLAELNERVALIATGHYLDELRSNYEEFPRILEYLDSVQSDLIENISDFLPEDEEGQEPSRIPVREPADPMRRYRINVMVDHSEQEGAPVIEETHPTYRNLIGYSEREARMGTLHTDFTLIRSGSILAANGGFLILDLRDLLTTPLAWDSLKRVLQDGEVKIQDPSEIYGAVATSGLRPEPVPVKLKVIVLGIRELYALLYQHDEDFQKLFKIRAEFDTVMKKQETSTRRYAQFVRTLCKKEDLRPLNADGVAVVVEHSSRMVSDKTRLTLRFSDVADVIRESNYWAREAGKDVVGAEEVRKAIEEKIYRSNLYEEKLQEMIDEGSIMISTRGEKEGQINGLSVYQVGDYAFGKPTRITAQVSVGDEGIINIEREAKMSGNIHDKGVLILSGYLHATYGQERPLSLQCSICFEQSYSGVDGDSASSTELYAIISSLSEVPLKQSIAVTGSINQKGLIQPIGGVNEKIEGFFDTCRGEDGGLTGDQGVIIPHQNVQNLMLKQEVIDAVERGDFHIYAIERVEEGLEILTGVEAGSRQEDGSFPEGTLHYLADQRLEEMAEAVRRHRHEESKSTAQ